MQVKICGLTTPESVRATVTAGAEYIGLNFFPKSPRYVSFSQAAELSKDIPKSVTKVALTVDADDQYLTELLAVVPVDILQLHGSETIARVAKVKARFGLPVMKAVGLADKSDLPSLDAYSEVVDMLLVDAKPPKGSALLGGNAVAFDWRLIANRSWTIPWMLAGGLKSENVAEAVRLTGAKIVDVSSGVESERGIKDLNKIAAFVKAAKGAV